MRMTHSSRSLRVAGYLAIAFGGFGLLGQSTGHLKAQDSPLPAPVPRVVANETDATADESARTAITLADVIPARFAPLMRELGKRAASNST